MISLRQELPDFFLHMQKTGAVLLYLNKVSKALKMLPVQLSSYFVLYEALTMLFLLVGGMCCYQACLSY